MRALSVKQPFAEMIASGKKPIEYRTRSSNCLGELLIVASKTLHQMADDYEGQYDPKALVFGKAICVVDFFKVTREGDCYAWHVRNPRRVEPVALKGSASFYHVKDEWIRFVNATSVPRRRA